jgi:hypothetical protein
MVTGPANPAAAARSAPFTRPPLPAPGEKSGDWDSYPPGQYALSGNFFKKSFPGEYPPRMGPSAKKFKPIFDRGITPESQIPLRKACTRFYGAIRFDQGVAQVRGSLWLEVLSAGEFGQDKG